MAERQAEVGSPPVMLGLQMPDFATWSDRVVTALGQNPGPFTGPGTNTYLVGTGARRILLDTGDGRAAYLPVLERALEHAGCTGLQEIVLTHGHPDHIGGVASVIERFGALRITKLGHPAFDSAYGFEINEIGDGDVVETEGASLRALHTPGHAPDHLCFVLEEEQAIFTGDNVLGVGTTVIPVNSGDLGQYMHSLDRLLGESPRVLFPAHGPRIEDGVAKIREYIAHRLAREKQILEVLSDGADRVAAIVAIIYAAYPATLHAAAGQSVGAHLLKLEREGRVRRDGRADGAPTEVAWRLV
jgi:ribonuclease/clavin/mitogillin